jgi:orotate phosphoribosyltransferase
LEVAEEGKDFDAKTLAEVRSFLTEPSKWSAAHGGIADFAASR